MESKGTLLIELLIVMAVLSLVLTAVVLLHVKGIRIFQVVKEQAIIQKNALGLVNGIANGSGGGRHGLRGAKSIPAAQETDIVFIDKNNDTIRYYLADNTVYKTINGGNDTIFFNFDDEVEVTSIEFQYFNNMDAQLTAPVAVPSDITKVKIIATIKGKETSDSQTTLTLSVKPRNLFQL